MTSPIVTSLVSDLGAEVAALKVVLVDLSDGDWRMPTPAPGWTVHDQIAHLAHFDEVTLTAITDPAGFAALVASMGDLQRYVDAVGPANSHRHPADMLAWWLEANKSLRAAALHAPDGLRVSWFGPSMSVPSKLTARIMETWAHGQDVVDTFGATRPATDRLRHVARIGVQTIGHSFLTHGRPAPTAPIHVSLTPPNGGAPWQWGDPGSINRVTGPAEDFCLVVTQRRHVQDTRLDVTGEVAEQWMNQAQAFAGPPGAGRKPGQFA